jgi:hypothetical protein
VTPPGEAAADEGDHGTDARSVRAVFVSGPCERHQQAIFPRLRSARLWPRRKRNGSRGARVSPAQLGERCNSVSMCHLWRKPVANATLVMPTQGGEQIPMQNVIYTFCG